MYKKKEAKRRKSVNDACLNSYLYKTLAATLIFQLFFVRRFTFLRANFFFIIYLNYRKKYDSFCTHFTFFYYFYIKFDK